MKVVNEIIQEVKRFKSIDEFEIFYDKNREEMDKHTTQYLNRVYKICTPDGTTYRITKRNCVKESGKPIKGDIYLKKVAEVKSQENPLENIVREIQDNNENLTKEITDMNLKIKTLQNIQSGIQKQILEMTNTLNQLANVVNQITGNAP